MKTRPVKLIFRKPFFSNFSIEYLFDSLFVEFKKNNISVQKVVLPHYSKGLSGRIKNLLSLFRFKDQIVHITGDVHYTLLGALRSKRLLTIHDLTFMDRTSGLTKKIYKWLWITLPVRFAHKVTVISEATKKELLTYTSIGDDKISVIPDFIDDIYQPVKRNFNENQPRILQIGTAFNKNLPNLIEALSGINCELVIIGKLTEQIKNLLEKHQVCYTNLYNLSLINLHKEYLNADLLTYVSTKEGFGMPILEAQSTCLPVVTSNCSSMPEVAGNGAVFVNPFSVQSIRQAIIAIVKNKTLREDIVAKGWENTKRYSKQKITSDYISVYNELNNN